MSRPRALFAALLAIALSAVAAGCGGGPGETTVRDGGTFAVTVTEFRIEPKQASVTAGRDGSATVTLVARNVGSQPHDVAIGQGGNVIARTTTIQPGQTAIAKDVVLPPGQYRVFDTISNNDVLGAYGFLIVRP